MLNLETKIAEWRQEMRRSGLKNPEVLDELENHLREEFERKTQSGTNAPQAFKAAVQCLGQADALKIEFDKTNVMKQSEEKKIIRAGCRLGAVFYLLFCGWAVLSTDLSLMEKTLGVLPAALSALFITGSPFLHRFLFAISNERVASTLRIGAIVFCVVGPVLAMNFILPRLNLTPGEVPIAVLWIITPFAIAGNLWQGFEDAHQKTRAQVMAE